MLPAIPSLSLSLSLSLPLFLLTSPVAATQITLSIPPSPQIPNPAILPPSTHATLTALGTSYAAPLTRENTFVFRNVTPGSYLGDIHCSTFGFAPLRVDVMDEEEGGGRGRGRGGGGGGGAVVKVWETFRGNDWENKGEEIKAAEGGLITGGGEAVFPVRVFGGKVYYTERGSFNVLSILKNPMIIMGMVTLALFIGMPKLMENMDPEMRAEFEEQSKKNPMNSLMTGSQGSGSPMGNFDMAGFLAGQGNNNNNNNNNNKGESDSGSGSGSGNGGRKKR
ncbi:hypothetical protein GGR50DRAFT_674339 [Xylaria sp. CBS 124048]|nr:hypothetical protein GGR50DRAFT_674339 [Xylaria sp. CBS 124048]